MELDLGKVDDNEIIKELNRRLEEKNASITEMEFMTKKLLELNEQTQKAEVIKGEFLSIIKNEFNNPLSTVLNMGRSLEKKTTDPKQAETVKMINMEMVRLDFHFQNVFAATEIEAGEIANFFTTVDFDSLLEDAQKPLRYISEDKNLTIEYDNRIEEPIRSDEGKLLLILRNLLSNAMEFSYPDSTVSVQLSSDTEFFYLTVADQGEGIHLDYHSKIFDRFSKFSTGRTRAHTGLGLGLSVIRGLAEALEGSVEFTSQEGATSFTAQLPKHHTEMEVEDPEAEESLDMFDDFDDGVEL